MISKGVYYQIYWEVCGRWYYITVHLCWRRCNLASMTMCYGQSDHTLLHSVPLRLTSRQMELGTNTVDPMHITALIVGDKVKPWFKDEHNVGSKVGHEYVFKSKTWLKDMSTILGSKINWTFNLCWSMRGCGGKMINGNSRYCIDWRENSPPLS